MYGQKNYNELQGRNNPANGKKPVYSIRQIGCLLVAISNLLKERFNVQVDPLQLNAFFRDHNVYIDVDDGVLDDLFWQAVTTFAPHIVVENSSSTKGKLPPHTRSIIKMAAKNSFGTHFCLYDGGDYIFDSWDGQRKSRSSYGEVLGYATYKDATPQPVQPVVEPPAPANPDQMTVQAGWGISHCLKFRGYPVEDYSSTAKWQWVAELNGISRWEDFKLKPGQVITLPSYRAPAPAPEPAPQSDVIEITVGSGWGITHVLKAAGYSKEQWENEAEWDRVARLNGSNERLRLRPGQVIKVNRNPLPKSEPAPESTVTTPAVIEPSPSILESAIDSTLDDTAPIAELPPRIWKDSFTTDGAGEYLATRSLIVKDIEGLHISLQLRKGTKVTVAGAFEKDGKMYYRSARHEQRGQWYGIPDDAIKPQHAVDEFDEIDMDMDLKGEAREAMHNLSFRQVLLRIVATIQGKFSRKKK